METFSKNLVRRTKWMFALAMVTVIVARLPSCSLLVLSNSSLEFL